MINNLTREQIEALSDFVAFVKREDKIYHPPRLKEIEYDHIHGEGEAVELLNRCFYDIIKIEKLSKQEIQELAGIVSQRELQFKIDPDDIFNKDLEFLNEINSLNRKRHKTNGQEYLNRE